MSSQGFLEAIHQGLLESSLAGNPSQMLVLLRFYLVLGSICWFYYSFIGSGNEQLSETLRKPIPGSPETNKALGKLNT